MDTGDARPHSDSGADLTADEQADAESDRALLTANGIGAHDAFGRIFDRHINAVYWKSYSIVADADLAQDVAQDVFITTWRRRREIHFVDDSMLPWLLVTAKLTAQNAQRKIHRLRSRSTELTEVEFSSDVDDVAATVDSAAVATAIATAVDQLSPKDRELFELCVEGDHSYAEAAEILGVSHGAVRNRLSRVRTRLRRDLAGVWEQK